MTSERNLLPAVRLSQSELEVKQLEAQLAAADLRIKELEAALAVASLSPESRDNVIQLVREAAA